MGHSTDVVYTKDDAIIFANELLKRIPRKDMSPVEANELAWRIRWVIEKWDLTNLDNEKTLHQYLKEGELH